MRYKLIMLKDYQIQYLNLEKKRKLFEEARKKSYSCQIDYLNCKESAQRQASDLTFEELLDQKLNDGCHCVFIYRPKISESFPEHYDVGFSTFEAIPHYLFLELSVKDATELINKFKLKTIV
jgi:hypothetical protein